MASSVVEQLMNLSLETKLGIYENMVEHVGERPVIFTSRPEIWSKDTNPVIIVGHPFPSASPSDNPEPIDLTREMMEYYQDLTPEEKEQRFFHLVLFQFQVGGSTEVHAVFSREKSNAKDNPAEIYLKHLEPKEVLIRECSTESSSGKTLKTSVSMVLASEMSFARPASISGSIRSAIVTTKSADDDDEVRDIGPIVSRLGTEVCYNLEDKVGLFQDEITLGVDGVVFTNVPGLWNTKFLWKLIEHPMPPIPANYDHERFDIEEDIFEYIKHAAKPYSEPFDAHSRKFGDGKFADVHLMFTNPSAILDG